MHWIHRLAGMSRHAVIALLASVILGGCMLQPGATGSPPEGSTAGTNLTGRVVAGPTCPVVTEPPQSGCNARPVNGAVVLVLDSAGTQVARATSAADGSFAIELPPGRYRLVPQPVEGLMGTAPAHEITIGPSSATVTITYDTGIR
jgi:hypothetical protein